MGNIYSRYKIFHYQEKLDSLPADNKEIKAWIPKKALENE